MCLFVYLYLYIYILYITSYIIMYICDRILNEIAFAVRAVYLFIWSIYFATSCCKLCYLQDEICLLLLFHIKDTFVCCFHGFRSMLVLFSFDWYNSFKLLKKIPIAQGLHLSAKKQIVTRHGSLNISMTFLNAAYYDYWDWYWWS